MLLDGRLDVAPISSIEYARHASSLRILPRMCVSSEGAVESIQLVSKLPFTQIRSVAVTPESATSVVLMKVLLPHATQVPLDPRARPGQRRREAADRRRGAQERLCRPDAALRPRQALARAHRPADGLRGLGGSGAARAGPARAGARARRLGPARAVRARGARARGQRALRLSRPAISRATSRSCATRSARARRPASTPSWRWRGTSASSSTCPSSVSSMRLRPRSERWTQQAAIPPSRTCWPGTSRTRATSGSPASSHWRPRASPCSRAWTRGSRRSRCSGSLRATRRSCGTPARGSRTTSCARSCWRPTCSASTARWSSPTRTAGWRPGDEDDVHAAVSEAGGPDTQSLAFLVTDDQEATLRADVQRVRSWPYLTAASGRRLPLRRRHRPAGAALLSATCWSTVSAR